MSTLQLNPRPETPGPSSSRPRQLRLRSGGRSRPGGDLIVTVVTDSLEDVEVARAAAELAVRPGTRLVLAVPLPGEGVLVEQGLPGLPGDLSVPADARAAVGRVRPVLDRYGVPFSVLAVPYRDRGGPRRRGRRIAAALLRTAQGLRARGLVLGEYACWEPEAPRVADRLLEAHSAGRTGRVEITVVRASAPTAPLTATRSSTATGLGVGVGV